MSSRVSASPFHVSTPHVVTKVRTATDPSEFRVALSRAYERVTGSKPKTATLDLLTAHASHETGRGQAMFNYNFGGLKGASPRGAIARYATREVENGQDRHIVDGFRAYRSLDEGAVDYVAFLQSHYAAALKAADGGNPDVFTAELKKRGYFTEELAPYAQSIRALVHDPTANGRAVTAGASSVGRVDPSRAASMQFELSAPPDAGLSPIGLLDSTEVARVVGMVADLDARIARPIDQSDRGTEPIQVGRRGAVQEGEGQ
jgi:hypothetical protein